MYNADTIKTSFVTLNGFRQNDDPSGVQLSSLLQSDSGRYLNNAHPNITLTNLESIAKRFDSLTYTAWNVGTTYTYGDRVTEAGASYVYINSADTAANVVTDTDFWDTAFTYWLKTQLESSIINSVDLWKGKKFKNGSAKSLLVNSRLFDHDGYGDLTGTSSGFSGFEVIPKKSKGLKNAVLKVGVQLTSADTVNLELRKVGDPTLIKTTAISYTGTGEVQWFSLTDWTFDSDGTYRIGYSDVVTYVNGVKDHQVNYNGVTIEPRRSKYLLPTAFTSADLTTPGSTKYTTTDNYGLNLEFDVKCDYTDFVVDQRLLFAELVYYQTAIDLLELLIYNPEAKTNRNESNVSEFADKDLLYNIHGDTQGKPTGLIRKRDEALEAILFDETAIAPECLNCRRKGIRRVRG